MATPDKPLMNDMPENTQQPERAVDVGSIRLVMPLAWLLSGNIMAMAGIWIADRKAPAGAICFGFGILISMLVLWLTTKWHNV